ncbi:unnamed protein product [Albugo candida]|uniref:HSF-type DNA-binding domain-containing protein n=1 Tax=Albugo candida TaxID=65357 RepID=A0A024GVI5_9STRA|nr:unnamed protein product [Albugo candida]|eukprot:CCI50642.1 unnamed protein product [Albugo candida]
MESITTKVEPRETSGQSPCKTLSHVVKAQDEKSKEVAPFLKNLRRMLEEESDEVLRWTDDGRAFEIHDMENMMESILPKYFKHRKYTSFQRQLNYFNFKKWTKSKAVVCTFSNEHFIRDNPDLAWKITRKKSISLSNYKNAMKSRGSAVNVTSLSHRRSSPSDTTNASLPPASMLAHYDPVWKWDQIAITIPGTSGTEKYLDHEFSAYPASFPSPTDMDMMLHEFDHPHLDQLAEATYPQSHPHIGRILSDESSIDSLDWIDQILPTLDVHEKMDHHVPHGTFKEYLFGSSQHPVHGIQLPLHESSHVFNSVDT